ncbi:uncharacterized protein C2845_PM05G20530 [Panicum miliaceum]|uniref:Uncharacterized protein n=1 Tax=Panicum miliaceum TaxID=4540 RepID=A0A3L6T4P1_PANMI|nr:uncharacterized protein C2845_PM05G20530 [Panicum miliaceum]
MLHLRHVLDDVQVPPWWLVGDTQCLEMMVDKWCVEDWEEIHNSCRQRRLMMPGAPHHQGNLHLSQYAARWSAAHGPALPPVQAWAMAHKGKETSDVTYNPEDPPEAYSNPTIHSLLSGYSSMAREIHGPEYDLSTQPIDGEIVMRVGGGKKHGRYWFAYSTLDTASTPTLTQTRARSTSSSPAIRPRPDST